MRAGDSGYHGPDQGGRASDRQSSADARDRMAEPPGETPRPQAAPLVPARRPPRAARRLAADPRTRPQPRNALGAQPAPAARPAGPAHSSPGTPPPAANQPLA